MTKTRTMTTTATPVRVSRLTGRVTRGPRPGVCGDCWRASGLAGDFCDRFRRTTHTARLDAAACGPDARHWQPRTGGTAS